MANNFLMNYGQQQNPLANAAYSAVIPGLSNNGLTYTPPTDLLSSLNAYASQGTANSPLGMRNIGGIDQNSIANAIANVGGVGAGAEPSIWDKLLSSALNKSDGNGGTDQGWLSPTLQGIGGLSSSLLGLKQYGLAKDQFDFQKQAYQTNLANQSKLTNSRLADRQAQRVANNPNSTSVADYLKQYGV